MPFSNDPYGFFPPTQPSGFFVQQPNYDSGAQGLQSRFYLPGSARGGFRSPGYQIQENGPMFRYGPRGRDPLWATDEQPMADGRMTFAQWNRWQQMQQQQQQMEEQRAQARQFMGPPLQFWPWEIEPARPDLSHLRQAPGTY